MWALFAPFCAPIWPLFGPYLGAAQRMKTATDKPQNRAPSPGKPLKPRPQLSTSEPHITGWRRSFGGVFVWFTTSRDP